MVLYAFVIALLGFFPAEFELSSLLVPLLDELGSEGVVLL